jgi:hypothetical protein
MRRPQQMGLDHTAYRASEMILLLIVTRFFAWWVTGQWPLWSEFGNYLRYPLLLLNDVPFLVGLTCVFIAWLRSVSTSDLFNRLSLSMAEVFYYAQSQNKRDSNDRPIPMRRADLVYGYFQQWVTGGIVIILLTAGSSIDLPALITQDGIWGVTRLGLRPPLLLALIIYFLAGFALLSQGRLAAMNAKWLHEGVQKAPNIERSWHRYTVWLVLVISGIALFLPLGSTLGISQILQVLIVWISYFFTFMISLFLAIISLFFSGDDTTLSQEVFETPLPLINPLPTPAPSAAAPPNDVLGIVFSSAFWAVAIVLGVMAITFFLRERGWKLDATLFRGAFGEIRLWLRAFWHSMGKQAGKIREIVQERLQRPLVEGQEPGRNPWRFLRLNDLSPRERIRYFYLSTVKRAASKGVVRQKSETPLEFTQDLKEEWPDAEADIEALTDAFLAARYSPQELDEEDVNPIKRRWRQIKNNIRKH